MHSPVVDDLRSAVFVTLDDQINLEIPVATSAGLCAATALLDYVKGWGALNQRISTEKDPCNDSLAYGLLFDYPIKRSRMPLWQLSSPNRLARLLSPSRTGVSLSRAWFRTSLGRGARDERTDNFCRFPVRRFNKVAVHLQCHRSIGVPEPTSNRPNRDTGGYKPGGRKMTKIVKSNLRQTEIGPY